jgi:hypothetical protein
MDLYFSFFIISPDNIRVMKSRRTSGAGHVANMWEKKTAYRVVVGKSERKIQLGRQRRRG